MQLPFTHEQFLDAFGAYNTTWWFAGLALWLLSAFAAIVLARGQVPPRLLLLLLALHWAWSGAVYHLGYFTAINPAAKLFGVAFLLQGAIFVGTAVSREVPSFNWGRAPRQWLSICFVLYSLIYPLLILAAGYHWPRMPASGVPCPTTLFTIGLVLAIEPGRFRVLLTMIPLLWTLVGGSAAFVLGVAPDWALLLGALALAAYGIAPKLLEERAA